MHVVVLERREAAGGTVGTVTLMPGVRAPAVAQTVGRLRAEVQRDLRLRDYRLRLVQPDVRSTSVRPDGPAITLWGDAARTARDLPSSAVDAGRYVALDTQTRRLGAVLARLMAMTPPDPSRPALGDVLGGLRVGIGFRGLGADDGRAFLRVLAMPVADHVADWIEDDALRAALAWRGVRYSGLGPRDPGSTQTFLSDTAGTGEGVAGETVLVRGGPGRLVEALANAARGLGAEIRTGVEVAAIGARDEQVSGVTLADGETVEAPVVASGVDPKRTLLGLVDPAVLGPQLGWQAGNLRLRGSVAKVDLALSDLPTFPGIPGDDAASRLRGRILIAPAMGVLDRAADAVKAGRVADELVLETTIPSLVDPSLIDDGAAARHVMSVLVQGVPYHRRDGAAWDADREALGDRVVARIEAVAPGIGALIVARRVLTPLDLERDYGLTEGHPLHGEPSLDQWFAWRPMLGLARYRLPIGGLYLCGSGAHPGGGVTGWPGRNAAREIIADTKRRGARWSAR
jgi:phytoene dehydrogenase-like protein